MDPEYKYKRIYNPNSNRYHNHDYSENGYYFITICTKDRENFFGNIVNGKMILNGVGEIVENEILNLFKNYNNLKIDKFIVMPNHIHFILIKSNETVETSIYGVSNLKNNGVSDLKNNGVSDDKNDFYGDKNQDAILFKNQDAMNRVL